MIAEKIEETARQNRRRSTDSVVSRYGEKMLQKKRKGKREFARRCKLFEPETKGGEKD